VSFKKPFRSEPVRLGEHYRAEKRRKASLQTAKFIPFAALAGVGVFVGGMAITNPDKVAQFLPRGGLVASTEEQARMENSVFYSGCDEARAAGAAPIHQGTPGYREGMDGDGDGIACEPHRGW